jgi:hypothetical protein
MKEDEQQDKLNDQDDHPAAGAKEIPEFADGHSAPIVPDTLWFDTIHAACARRVHGKSDHINFFFAYKALAELSDFYAVQSAINFLDEPFTLPGAFFGSFLCLHGIHAGKAAHAGLVRLHWLGPFTGSSFKVLKRRPKMKQLLPKLFNFRYVHSRI